MRDVVLHLGGTVPAATGRNARHQRQLMRDDRSRTLVLPRNATPAEFQPFVEGRGNNVKVTSFYTYQGIFNKGDTITAADIPTSLPTQGTTYADGLGYGKAIGTAALAWVATRFQDDSGNLYSGMDGLPIIYGSPFLCYASVDVIAADGSTATVWIPYTQ